MGIIPMNFLINTIFAESEKMTAEGKTHHLKYIPRIFELRADPTKATVNELMDLYSLEISSPKWV